MSSEGANHSALFVAPAAYPLGGVAEWLHYLMPGLASLGWKCTLGLTEGRFHDAEAYLRRHPWADTLAISNATGSPYGRAISVADAIRRVQPSVVVAVNIAAAYEAVRHLRRRDEPTPRVVMALHGLERDLFDDLRAAEDVLDGVVTVNRLAYQLARTACQDPARVFYAPCGVAPPHDPPRVQLAQDHRPVRLLYSGRLEQDQKRVLDLPDLAATLVARRIAFGLSIAGAGPAEALLRGKAESLGVQTYFKFLGALDPAQLSLAYQNHDALILTSEWETGPLVAWEAMSHGLPLISSRYIGSGLEGALVDGQNCLLFPVTDIAAAADAVERLTAPTLVDQLVKGGYRLVSQRYSRENSVRAWAQSLQSVLQLSALPRPIDKPGVPAGRLDKWLGPAGAERARRALRISYRHQEPGGEWPHTLGSDAPRGLSFLEMARQLDRQRLDPVPAQAVRFLKF